jgi:hypothetical protein
MIIHSPIFSGSINQAATSYANLSGSFSGSFTGSFKGDGSLLGGVTANSITYENVTGKPTLVSGSSQVSYPQLSDIPSGIISSSAQIDVLFNIDGLISGSSQVSYPGLSNIPSGIVSGSSQVTPLLPTGVISGSSQVVYTSLSSIPAGIVSGSTQVQFNDITNNPFSSSASNITITAGKKIRSSDENTIIIAENIDVEGNITLLGAVDGVDIAAFKTDFDAFKVQTFVTGSSQVVGILSSLNTYTSSNDTKWDTLGSLSGSFARTNSTNIFSGNQTITGSLFVSQDLIVQGSSSIQNVSSSVLNIGTNLITVAVNQPSVRFGGLAVIDSGSAGQSGSFLYDSLQDEFIFLHRGDGTNITSSHFVLGPETYNNLGNETYLTNNRVSKGTGKEHLVDSNITDNGTTITLGSNTVVTGTLLATGTSLVSGSSQIDVASTTGDIILGTRTSGNYVASLVAGTNITLSNNSGEGSTPTIGLTNNTISGISLGSNLATLTIGTGLSGTSYNGSGAVTIANTGVTSNVAGTGVTVSGATGAVTISIGQAVSTTSEVQFAKVGVGGAHDATYELKVTGDIGATGDIVAYVSSDERLKNNVEIISNPIEKVQSLRGVTWEWNELASDAAKQSPNVGVIAQEVEKVLPQLVHDRENGFKGVDYAKLTGLLIEAIKEQQKQIDELTSRL